MLNLTESVQRARNRAAIRIADCMFSLNPQMAQDAHGSVHRVIRENCGIERRPDESLIEYIGRAVHMTPEQVEKCIRLAREGVDVKEAERIARLTA